MENSITLDEREQMLKNAHALLADRGVPCDRKSNLIIDTFFKLDMLSYTDYSYHDLEVFKIRLLTRVHFMKDQFTKKHIVLKCVTDEFAVPVRIFEKNVDTWIDEYSTRFHRFHKAYLEIEPTLQEMNRKADTLKKKAKSAYLDSCICQLDSMIENTLKIIDIDS